jgi:DNA-binding NtrC family response regulator
MSDPHGVPSGHPTARLVGQAPAIQTLRTQLRQLAAFDAVGKAAVPTVLLSGETGTGKGLVARILHDSGPRVHGPFIDVNCAAIPETMLEAELFGYEAGAFTDAKRAKAGLFEAASGGTLFLDEIDALPVLLQSKLLTVIEEKRLRRLGAVAGRAVDVKLIAATAADLRARVAAGQFRLDVYHRLAVVLLELPPLRTRGADIAALARQFLRQYAAAHRVSVKHLSPTAETWLLHQAWPGNVRELSHLMERVTLLHPEERVEAAALAQFCLPPPPGERAADVQRSPALAVPSDEPTRIRQALIQTGGNVVRAAQLLGLRRDALRYRMRRHSIRSPTLAELSVSPLSMPSSGRGPTGESPPHGPGTLTTTGYAEGASAWEPKQVAILAVDLTWPASSMPEHATYDPWTAVAPWEYEMVEKVQGFGGVVLQHMPSLLLIAFGIPRTLEQQPRRCGWGCTGVPSWWRRRPTRGRHWCGRSARRWPCRCAC